MNQVLNASECFRQSAGHLSLSCLIAGTGGLGVVGLTRLVADCLSLFHPCVHTEETRGIAQRRAPVKAVVRAGANVRSARLPDGVADVVLAVEAAEALRALPVITVGTVCLVSDLMVPASGAAGAAQRSLGVEEVVAALEAQGAHVVKLPVAAWLRANRLPDMLASTVVFGAAARAFGATRAQAEALLKRQIGNRMWALNQQALQLGYGTTAGDANAGAAVEPARQHAASQQEQWATTGYSAQVALGAAA